MANNAGGQAPRKQKINEWTGEGIVRPRSGNDGDEIRFFPFQRGGGAIHITVACTEQYGASENGQPKEQTSYVPVNVITNSRITEEQLKGVCAGMRVRVVGKLTPESYTSKRTGQKVTTLVVNAFVFEVLAMPAHSYAPQGGYAPQQAPYPPQAPAYAPQAGYPGPAAAPLYPPYQGATAGRIPGLSRRPGAAVPATAASVRAAAAGPVQPAERARARASGRAPAGPAAVLRPAGRAPAAPGSRPSHRRHARRHLDADSIRRTAP